MGRVRENPRSRWFDGNVHLYWLELSFRTNDVLAPELLAAQEVRTSAWQRMRLADLRLRVLIKRGAFDAALEAAEHHQRLAYNAGFDTTPATIAYLLAKSGRPEAVAAVEETLARLPTMHPADRPHLRLAQAFLELGRRDEAVRHAHVAYRQAWGSGPPNYLYWDLRDAMAVLAQLEEKPPYLPITNAATVEIPMAAPIHGYLDRLGKR